MTSSSSSSRTKDDWSCRYRIAQEKIDSAKDELNQLSQAIWNNPELKYQEHFAHKVCPGPWGREGYLNKIWFTAMTKNIYEYT